MAAYSGCGERDGGIATLFKRRSRTGLARVCGDVGLAGGSVADGRRQSGSGIASQSGQGDGWTAPPRASAGEDAGSYRRSRAGDPSGLGFDDHRLTVLVVTICPDPGLRAAVLSGQEVSQHLYRQPFYVGGEAA